MSHRQPNLLGAVGSLRGVKLALMIGIADGLSMPDFARMWLGIRPAQITPLVPPGPALSEGDDDELLRQVSSARYLDQAVIAVMQQETDAIRLLAAGSVPGPSPTSSTATSLTLTPACITPRDSSSSAICQGLAVDLADTAALSGWQAIDMGNLTAAWHRFELATAAAREADDHPLLAFAAGEQGYVLLDLGQPGQALDKVRAVHDQVRHRVPDLIRTWLSAAEAEIAAAVKYQDACRTALDEAATHLEQPGTSDALRYLALNDAHLARWRGNCLVQFGDTATITDLRVALNGMDGTFTRAEAGLRCDLAAACTPPANATKPATSSAAPPSSPSSPAQSASASASTT